MLAGGQSEATQSSCETSVAVQAGEKQSVASQATPLGALADSRGCRRRSIDARAALGARRLSPVGLAGVVVGSSDCICGAAALSGLEAGDALVTDGAFTLKAQLEKDAFGDGHAH